MRMSIRSIQKQKAGLQTCHLSVSVKDTVLGFAKSGTYLLEVTWELGKSQFS